VTDPSQPAEPQPGDALPEQGGDLPRRKPGGGSQPQPGGSFFERAEPLPPSTPQPSLSNGLPQRRSVWEPLPADSDRQHESVFQEPNADSLPRRDDLPQRGQALPQRNAARDAGDFPSRDPGTLPQRNGSDLPQRAPAGDGVGALPRRTTRTRPAGRHRSPHRLSVASDAPALVIAVPGHAQADSDEIGPRVAATAALSCPGVDIRIGYLDGDELPLSECLLPDGPQAEDHDQFPSVVVPLLLSPNATIDARLRQLTASPPIPVVLGAHLGPHPLVAEALHARLADAGLARQARSTGLSISAESRGIVVLADVGEEAASAAGVAAVLLASRLSVPVVPASLGDPASIVDAVGRLSESGAARPVLAPCLIGPETNLAVLEDLSAALGAPCAPTLGAHQAIGQLVAIRYGAALASLSLTG
jgi:sirohydrochlorin ferrochelatase